MNNNYNKTYSLKENPSFTYGKINHDNLLIHGDSVIVLDILKKKYAGKINCIYMDPPYCSGTKNEHYSDIFEPKEYLKMIRKIVVLSYELLSDEGFLFLQMGKEYSHTIRNMVESVFQSTNFRNEIIIKREDNKIYDDTILRLASGYDVILFFSKKADITLPALKRTVDEEERKGRWKNLYRSAMHPRRQYSLNGIRPQNGEWRWPEEKSFEALCNYNQLSDYAKEIHCDIASEFDNIYRQFILSKGIITEFPILRIINNRVEFYVPPSDEIFITDNWSDINIRGGCTDFEHEVNEEILKRIIGWVTTEGDTILDPFLGSGTSAATACKMNRKWIGIEREIYCRTDIRNRINKVIDEMCTKNQSAGYKFMELSTTGI